MHGPGLPPQHGPQPSTAGVVTLRVLFMLLPLLSCGFLAWGTMLRLALVTRKARDWTLLAASCVLAVGWVALIGADPTPDTSGWQGNLGAFGTIATGLATCVYFLVADIRHYEARAASALAGPGHWYPAPAPVQASPYAPPRQAPGYGYPPVPPQATAQTAPQHPAPTPVPAPAAEPTPPPTPAPQPRIGQVRAELDELSELLRQQTPAPQQNPNPNPNPNQGQDPGQTAIQDPGQ